MFDVAPTELLLVAVVALVVIGPKDLPKAMRLVGGWVSRARGMARHFRAGFDEMMRQAELEDLEKKWAAENARIMAESPPSADEASEVVATIEAAATAPQPAAAERELPLAKAPSKEDPAA